MTMLASRGQLRASFIRWALFTVPLCVLLGFLSGQLGGPDTLWFQSLEKPAIFPPAKWFGIVWGVLFVMIGLALAVVCAAWGARGRTAALWVFAGHFALTLAWTPVFFAAQQIFVALIVLVLVVLTLLVVIALFWKVRRMAGLLLLPYLAWVIFASVLNYQFYALNPDTADASAPDGAIERVRIGD